MHFFTPVRGWPIPVYPFSLASNKSLFDRTVHSWERTSGLGTYRFSVRSILISIDHPCRCLVRAACSTTISLCRHAQMYRRPRQFAFIWARRTWTALPNADVVRSPAYRKRYWIATQSGRLSMLIHRDREMMWVAVLEPEPKQEHCKAIWELRKSP